MTRASTDPKSGRRLVIAIAAAVGVTAALLLTRRGVEDLTREALDAAREQWKANGPAAYTMEIVVSGAQSGEHRVSVAGDGTIRMTTGGAPVREEAARYWSVDGMFTFLDQELRLAERQTEQGAQVVLQAEFDERLGYPRRFLRHQMGQTRGIEWLVRSFEVAAD